MTAVVIKSTPIEWEIRVAPVYREYTNFHTLDRFNKFGCLVDQCLFTPDILENVHVNNAGFVNIRTTRAPRIDLDGIKETWWLEQIQIAQSLNCPIGEFYEGYDISIRFSKHKIHMPIRPCGEKTDLPSNALRLEGVTIHSP